MPKARRSGKSARPRHLSAASRRGSPSSDWRRCCPIFSGLRSARRARQHAGRSRDAFAAQQSAIRQRLLSGTALQSDETGLRVGKSNWWLWVFHSRRQRRFVAEPSRPRRWSRIFLAISGRLLGVRSLWRPVGLGRQGKSGLPRHLIRDVQYAIDSGDDVFAPDLRHLLGRACRIGRRRERLSDATLKTYKSRLEARLDELMARAPMHAAGVKLQNMIKRTRRHLFVFVTNRELPPTNTAPNGRCGPARCSAKSPTAFARSWGAKLYADIRSVIETGRRRASEL